MTQFKHLIFILLCAAMVLPAQTYAQDTPAEPNVPAEISEEDVESRDKVLNSLSALYMTLSSRQAQRDGLRAAIEAVDDETREEELGQALQLLTEDIAELEAQIETIALGLQAQGYREDAVDEQQPFNLAQEVGNIFKPLVESLERATEPSRRMEDLRQDLQLVDNRLETAKTTLQNIENLLGSDSEISEGLRERLERYKETWTDEVIKNQNLSVALAEQLQIAKNAQGNTLERLGADIGNFILNRGVSLALALGLAFAFVMLCQGIRIGVSALYRRRRGQILPASLRVFNLILNLLGVVGALIIAIAIFNIRRDWLLLALSLLLGVAISWSIVRALPIMLDQMRLLLNLGAAREGERTVINGVPYRIDRLTFYSEMVNPALEGGKLIYPIKEMLGMHSRPVNPDEEWFPTEKGDWLVYDDKHYEVIRQTPEHVIIRRPGGATDFLPTGEFIDKEFLILSNGYRASYGFGLAYKHMSEARDVILEKVSAAVGERLEAQVGRDAVVSVNTYFETLDDSSLGFKVLADIGSGQGSNWLHVHRAMNLGVVDACIDNDWEIPFPQLVVYKGD